MDVWTDAHTACQTHSTLLARVLRRPRLAHPAPALQGMLATSKKSGTKRAADPAANHLRTDAAPKKPRLDTPPEKPPAVGTSGGAGKAEATRSASVATQLSGLSAIYDILLRECT